MGLEILKNGSNEEEITKLWYNTNSEPNKQILDIILFYVTYFKNKYADGNKRFIFAVNYLVNFYHQSCDNSFFPQQLFFGIYKANEELNNILHGQSIKWSFQSDTNTIDQLISIVWNMNCLSLFKIPCFNSNSSEDFIFYEKILFGVFDQLVKNVTKIQDSNMSRSIKYIPTALGRMEKIQIVAGYLLNYEQTNFQTASKITHPNFHIPKCSIKFLQTNKKVCCAFFNEFNLLPKQKKKLNSAQSLAYYNQEQENYNTILLDNLKKFKSLQIKFIFCKKKISKENEKLLINNGIYFMDDFNDMVFKELVDYSSSVIHPSIDSILTVNCKIPTC